MTNGISLLGRPRPAMVILAIIALIWLAAPTAAWAQDIPILLYHRFGPRVTDSMMVKTSRFESQLSEIEKRGYHVIPLRQAVDYLTRHGPPPPADSIVLTVDDGHRSVYTELLPVILRHHIPVTLFIYPSAISNASYALTWKQLNELQATGLFDIQSHTYWHPNFKHEKRRLSPADYERFVDVQLSKSKATLESHMGRTVNMLAWPFGIYDRELEQHAERAGYLAAFTMERRPAHVGDNPMALPRFLIIDAVSPRAFSAILGADRSGN